jgi:dTDP-4-amino-4,6-dideoxygalactose transaminase
MSIDHIQTQMAAYGIHIRKGVDSLIHRELNLQDNDFSNALLHFNQTFSLPYYPVLEIFESDYVVSSLLEVLN